MCGGVLWLGPGLGAPAGKEEPWGREPPPLRGGSVGGGWGQRTTKDSEEGPLSLPGPLHLRGTGGRASEGAPRLPLPPRTRHGRACGSQRPLHCPLGAVGRGRPPPSLGPASRLYNRPVVRPCRKGEREAGAAWGWCPLPTGATWQHTPEGKEPGSVVAQATQGLPSGAAVLSIRPAVCPGHPRQQVTRGLFA